MAVLSNECAAVLGEAGSEELRLHRIGEEVALPSFQHIVEGAGEAIGSSCFLGVPIKQPALLLQGFKQGFNFAAKGLVIHINLCRNTRCVAESLAVRALLRERHIHPTPLCKELVDGQTALAVQMAMVTQHHQTQVIQICLAGDVLQHLFQPQGALVEGFLHLFMADAETVASRIHQRQMQEHHVGIKFIHNIQRAVLGEAIQFELGRKVHIIAVALDNMSGLTARSFLDNLHRIGGVRPDFRHQIVHRRIGADGPENCRAGPSSLAEIVKHGGAVDIGIIPFPVLELGIGHAFQIVEHAVLFRTIAGNDAHMAGIGQCGINGSHILGNQRALKERRDSRILLQLLHILREHGIDTQNQ